MLQPENTLTQRIVVFAVESPVPAREHNVPTGTGAAPTACVLEGGMD